MDAGITYHSWHEPDDDIGFTAIATVPLTGEIRGVLANYRLYQYQSPLPRGISACTPPSKGGGAGLSPAGVATLSPVREGGRHLTSLECDSRSTLPERP